MNIKRPHLLRGIQFSVRTLLVVTALVCIDVAIISRARSSWETMAHVALVQLGLLLTCCLYYQRFQSDAWGDHSSPLARLYMGIGLASIVYGATIYTILTTSTQQLQDSVTHPGAVMVNIATISQAPIVCLMILVVSVVCAFATTAFVRLLYFLFWILIFKTPHEANETLLGGIVGGITPVGLLLLMDRTNALNMPFVLLAVLLPAALGAISCHLFSRDTMRAD